MGDHSHESNGQSVLRRWHSPVLVGSDPLEARIIGGILVSHTTPELLEEVLPLLSVAAFKGEREQLTFQCIVNCHGRGEPPLAVLVSEEAERLGYGKIVTGAVLSEFTECIDYVFELPFLAKRLAELRMRDRAANILMAAAKRAHDESEELEDVLGELDSLRSITGGAKVQFQWLTAAELAAAHFDAEYLIPGVLVARQPMIAGGWVKSLKTSIVAVDLTISLATGLPFLGKFIVPRRCRCGVLSGESGGSALQDTMRRVCRSKLIEPDDVDPANWIICHTVPDLTSARDVAELRSKIKGAGLEVILIDPAYLALGESGDDGANVLKMGKRLMPFGQLAQDMGVTPILVHHFSATASRARMNRPPQLDDFSHAGFAQFARQWLLLGRRSEYADDGRHELWMRCGGSQGHSGIWGVDIEEGLQSDADGRRWKVDVKSLSEVKRLESESKDRAKRETEQQQLTVDMQRVLEVLAGFPDGETQTVIAASCPMSNAKCKRALIGLDEAGEIEECPVKKNGRKEAGYRLPKT